jgi:hypothetical protein
VPGQEASHLEKRENAADLISFSGEEVVRRHPEDALDDSSPGGEVKDGAVWGGVYESIPGGFLGQIIG